MFNNDRTSFFRFALLFLLPVLASAQTTTPTPDPLYPVSYKHKSGFIDKNGQVVIPLTFDQVYVFSGNLAAARQGDQWGYIDRKGQFVIPPKYDAAGSFDEGLACVKIGKEYGFIDVTGKLVIPATSDESGRFIHGLAPFMKDGKIGYIDHQGHFVIPPRFIKAHTFPKDGLARVEDKDGWGFIDRKGRFVIAPQYIDVGPFYEDLAAVKKADHWGFMDPKQDWVVLPTYENVGYFHDGLAPAKVDKEWGFIDHQGHFVVRPHYSGCDNFSQGLAAVFINKQGGYIDTTCKMVIAPQFERAYKFEDGLAQVERNGIYNYIDKTGRTVWEPHALAWKGFGLLGGYFIAIILLMIGIAYAVSWRMTPRIKKAPAAERILLLFQMNRIINLSFFVFVVLTFVGLRVSTSLSFIDLYAIENWALDQWHIPATRAVTTYISFLLFLLLYLLAASFVFTANHEADQYVRKTTWTFGQNWAFKLRTFSIFIVPMVLWLTLRVTTEENPGLHLIYFCCYFLLITGGAPFLVRFGFRCHPLEDTRVRKRLEDLCEKADISVSGIWIWPFQAGRLANAMMAGIFPFARYIFMTDYLIDQFTLEEVEAVFAHELGHIRKKHLWIYMGFVMLFALTSGLLIWALSLMGLWDKASPNTTLVVILLWLLFYFLVIFPFIRRQGERDADLYAAELTGKPAVYIRTLEKLAKVNYSPRRINFFYQLVQTHPDIENRIREIKKIYSGD